MALAQVLCYFGQQEKLAIQRQDESKRTRCHATKQIKARPSSTVDVQEDIDPHDLSKPSSLKKAAPATAKQLKMLDTDPCPVHDHPHTWGACHLNHFNGHCQKRFHSDQDKKKDNNDSKKSTNQFATCLSSKKDKDKDKMDTASSVDESILNKDNEQSATQKKMHKITLLLHHSECVNRTLSHNQTLEEHNCEQHRHVAIIKTHLIKSIASVACPFHGRQTTKHKQRTTRTQAHAKHSNDQECSKNLFHASSQEDFSLHSFHGH
jgi:hypothetical protein